MKALKISFINPRCGQHRNNFVLFPKSKIVVGIGSHSAKAVAWRIESYEEYNVVAEVEVSRLVLPAAKKFIAAQEDVTRALYRSSARRSRII
jgi:hypothetical protein